MKTEEKIVAKALEMFNERGIEYVGLREIANSLQIRVSNINYYFPTKDDLVNRISLDLSQLNGKIIVAENDLTMHSFLEMFKTIFQNHVKYRCLLLSFVHLMEQNKPMAKRYKKTQRNRNEALTANLTHLNKSGYLNELTNEDLAFLVSSIALIARFWISEAAISFKQLSPSEQIIHYSNQIAKFLIPYSSPKGKDEINQFLHDNQFTTEVQTKKGV